MGKAAALGLVLLAGCATPTPTQRTQGKGGHDVTKTETEELRAQLRILDDAAAPRDAKRVACDRLTDAGTAAIPVLIERLHNSDDPIFLDAVRVQTGPMHAGAPVVRDVTVKFQVESLLYRIIYPEPWPADGPTPPADRGPANIAEALSPGILANSRPPLAFVEDWASWWKTHAGESLDTIRAWSLGEVDARWQRVYRETSAPPP